MIATSSVSPYAWTDGSGPGRSNSPDEGEGIDAITPARRHSAHARTRAMLGGFGGRLVAGVLVRGRTQGVRIAVRRDWRHAPQRARRHSAYFANPPKGGSAPRALASNRLEEIPSRGAGRCRAARRAPRRARLVAGPLERLCAPALDPLDLRAFPGFGVRRSHRASLYHFVLRQNGADGSPLTG